MNERKCHGKDFSDALVTLVYFFGLVNSSELVTTSGSGSGSWGFRVWRVNEHLKMFIVGVGSNIIAPPRQGNFDNKFNLKSYSWFGRSGDVFFLEFDDDD